MSFIKKEHSDLTMSLISDTEDHIISPTKPLNLKTNDETELMQQIPKNPNFIKGPRDVFTTPKKKTVKINFESPKVINFENYSSEESDIEENDELINNLPIWQPLSPKKRKPLPDINPNETSIMEEVEELEPVKVPEITNEDIKSIKQMTIETKLNAVLDNAPISNFDHDNYMESLKYKQLKSNKYYDDMLLSTVKDHEVEDYDGFTELYETNLRNTKDKKSLKLELDRSNSVKSQFSIASGERILPTTVESEMTPMKHSRQSSLTERLSPYKMGQFLVNVGSNLKKIVSSNDLKNLNDVETIDVYNKGIDIDGNNDEIGFDNFIKQEPELDEVDKFDKIIKTESDRDEIDNFDKVIKAEPDMDDSIDKIVKSEPGMDDSIPDEIETEKVIKSEPGMDDSISDELESDKSIHIDQVAELDTPIPDEVDTEKVIKTEPGIDDSIPEIETDKLIKSETDSDKIIKKEPHIEQNIEIPQNIKYRIESNPESDNSHSISLELTEDSIKPKQEFDDSFADILTPVSNGLSSPSNDVFSIWQSQPEFLRVPKHKTTRCSSSISSSTINRSNIDYKFQEASRKNSVHVISKRIISQEYDDDLKEVSELELPNLSGDSDFATDFQKFNLDNDMEDVLIKSELSKELSSDQKKIRNIWRNGTIRTIKSNHEEPIEVFSDEDHQVKNPLSTLTINQSSPIRQQFVTLEMAVTMSPMDEGEDISSDMTEIKTIDNNDVTMLSNISALEPPAKIVPHLSKPLPPNPLSTMTPSQVNTLPQQPLEKKLINGESGRMFLKLNSLSNLLLPGFRKRDAKFFIILDNGVHRIQTDYFKLDDRISIDREFEFILQDSLNLILTLKAKYDRLPSSIVEVKEREVVKSKGFFGKLLRDKHVITRTKLVTKPPPHDPWTDIMAKDGSFGKVLIDFKKFENLITGRAISYKLPIINEWNAKQYNQFSKIGSLDLQMLYLPRVSKFEIFPTSIRQAYDQLQLINKQDDLKFEGFLSQEGGDCPILKRRFFKLENTTLIAFNEDSLKTRCKINLKKVTELIHLNDLNSDRNFSDNLINFSFKLKFANNEIIEFIANDKYEKEDWISVLQQVINMNHFARQPWLKLMNQR